MILLVGNFSGAIPKNLTGLDGANETVRTCQVLENNDKV